jgi:hypothetical protein
MENVILELSQEKAGVLGGLVRSNGDWQTNLVKEIELNEGDELAIKNVFIDTTSITTASIQIEEDINLNLHFGYYLSNWTNTDKNFFEQTNKNLDFVNGEDYIAIKARTGGSNTAFLKSYTARYEKGHSSHNFGGCTITFEYKNEWGVVVRRDYQIPKLRKALKDYDVPINNWYEEGYSVKIITPESVFYDNNLKYPTFPANNISNADFQISGGTAKGNTIIDPIINSAQILLPAGNYQPDELAEYLSEKMAQNNIANVDKILNSPYLKTWDTLPTNPDGSTTSNEVYFMNKTGEYMFNFKNATDKYLIGASQIQFTYEPTFGKFNINFLHMPNYDVSSGKNISALYRSQSGTQYDGSSLPSGSFVSSKNSGIYFTSLTAEKVSDGSSYDFWDKELGFDVGALCVQVNQSDATVQFRDSLKAVKFAKAHPLTFDLIDGQNITAGYIGLDTIINKSASPAWQKLITTTPINYDAQINNSISIEAQKGYNSITESSSHFLIEITSKFYSKYISQEITANRIMGICSKYYGYQSFTSGGGEVSIPYVHTGEPVLLSSLGVRILNPDYSLSLDLGDKNTVFVQIQKQLQVENKK